MVPSPAAGPWSPITSGRSKTNRCPASATSAVCGCALTTALTRAAVDEEGEHVVGAPELADVVRSRAGRDPARRPVDDDQLVQLDPLGAGGAPSRNPSAWKGCPLSVNEVIIAWVQATRIARQLVVGRRQRRRRRSERSSQAVSISLSRNASLAASARRKPVLVVRPRMLVSSRAADQGLAGALAVGAVDDHLAEHRVVGRRRRPGSGSRAWSLRACADQRTMRGGAGLGQEAPERRPRRRSAPRWRARRCAGRPGRTPAARRRRRAAGARRGRGLRRSPR